MTDKKKVPMTLDEAKQLVTFLEKGDHESANALLDAVAMKESVELFAEVGKLTRQLHDSLNNFQLDDRIAGLANEEIPDAQTRLTYVIEETEKAANTTMDAVENSMPIVETMKGQLDSVMPEWKKLMNREIELDEFKSLCLDLDKFLEESAKNADQLMSLLTEVLMAQGYQDLTGQVIRRVIELVKEVEDSLVHMLTVFGGTEVAKAPSATPKTVESEIKAEGPIIDAESRDDVVSGQDDVDDLLSSLGF
ncbi:MAG: protein phosphatase CheZ [Alteromonadaceae bacterium]|nr:protein phosphatase CheZ [Alteromonadaceae bacterium]